MRLGRYYGHPQRKSKMIIEPILIRTDCVWGSVSAFARRESLISESLIGSATAVVMHVMPVAAAARMNATESLI